MLTRTLGSFTSSDRFAEVIFVAISFFVLVKFPGILLFPFAAALAVIPSVLIYALMIAKWGGPAKFVAVLAAMLLELWAAMLFDFAHAFAYGKPFLSFFE